MTHKAPIAMLATLLLLAGCSDAGQSSRPTQSPTKPSGGPCTPAAPEMRCGTPPTDATAAGKLLSLLELKSVDRGRMIRPRKIKENRKFSACLDVGYTSSAPAFAKSLHGSDWTDFPEDVNSRTPKGIGRHSYMQAIAIHKNAANAQGEFEKLWNVACKATDKYMRNRSLFWESGGRVREWEFKRRMHVHICRNGRQKGNCVAVVDYLRKGEVVAMLWLSEAPNWNQYIVPQKPIVDRADKLRNAVLEKLNAG